MLIDTQKMDENLDRYLVSVELPAIDSRIEKMVYEQAALEEAEALTHRLYEKHDGDEEKCCSEFYSIVSGNSQMLRAITYSVLDQLIEANPTIMELFNAGSVDQAFDAISATMSATMYRSR